MKLGSIFSEECLIDGVSADMEVKMNKNLALRGCFIILAKSEVALLISLHCQIMASNPLRRHARSIPANHLSLDSKP